jgi:hypothetical protein
VALCEFLPSFPKCGPSGSTTSCFPCPITLPRHSDITPSYDINQISTNIITKFSPLFQKASDTKVVTESTRARHWSFTQPATGANMSHMNQVHTFPSYFFSTHFNIILPPVPLPCSTFPFRFSCPSFVVHYPFHSRSPNSFVS